MRIYEYNADVGIFEIRQTEHARYELWIEDEQLGAYESPESAALDVAAFNTGYNEWDKFENDERNYPRNLGEWSKVEEESPQ
ncbi:MAG: hypothetical protein R3302_02350 [Sulfurimonadaceae bacterium]|nr:hypothetical protein [Sulfurimonadaceae bacterium]